MMATSDLKQPWKEWYQQLDENSTVSTDDQMPATPVTNFSSPVTNLATPATNYALPETNYAAPACNCAVPETNYAAPASNAALPETNYAAPMTISPIANPIANSPEAQVPLGAFRRNLNLELVF